MARGSVQFAIGNVAVDKKLGELKFRLSFLCLLLNVCVCVLDKAVATLLVNAERYDEAIVMFTALIKVQLM